MSEPERRAFEAPKAPVTARCRRCHRKFLILDIGDTCILGITGFQDGTRAGGGREPCQSPPSSQARPSPSVAESLERQSHTLTVIILSFSSVPIRIAWCTIEDKSTLNTPRHLPFGASSSRRPRMLNLWVLILNTSEPWESRICPPRASEAYFVLFEYKLILFGCQVTGAQGIKGTCFCDAFRHSVMRSICALDLCASNAGNKQATFV